jgi:hypothetical protein
MTDRGRSSLQSGTDDYMERQQMKLMDMIAALVGLLDERRCNRVTHSGRKHSGFGVQPWTGN